MGIPETCRSATSRYTVRGETRSVSASRRAVTARRPRRVWMMRNRRSARRMRQCSRTPVALPSGSAGREHAHPVAFAVADLREDARALRQLGEGKGDGATGAGDAAQDGPDVVDV